MQNISEQRRDLELRNSVDTYLEWIKTHFKESLYSSGTWDDQKVSQYCDGVAISSRDKFLQVVVGKNKTHIFIAKSNSNSNGKVLKRGDLIKKTLLGSPNPKVVIGNILEDKYAFN
ncbi:hypothetical protein [Polynucleobacter rarus]|uniref:hypothetical protein n=1 Tax=Polynucleobacter rarus TaxID=556055 RepID=UPI000D3EB86B|nr:hypothetical protein [Polynucleobacter rarus]